MSTKDTRWLTKDEVEFINTLGLSSATMYLEALSHRKWEKKFDKEEIEDAVVARIARLRGE